MSNDMYNTYKYFRCTVLSKSMLGSCVNWLEARFLWERKEVGAFALSSLINKACIDHLFNLHLSGNSKKMNMKMEIKTTQESREWSFFMLNKNRTWHEKGSKNEFCMVLGGQPTPCLIFKTTEFAKSTSFLPCRLSTISRLCEPRSMG